MPVKRTIQAKLSELSRHFPVVTVTGPRQSGKTTLCKMAFASKPFTSLENPDVREYARTDPRGFLREHASGAVLDEVQRVPELLSYLQTDVDEHPEMGRFILTGSANFALLDKVSQSLAGRTAVLNLYPLGFEELNLFDNAPGDLFEVLFSGAFPAVFDRGTAPADWYPSYVSTYLERDVRQILNVGDLVAFQTFLRLCAGRTGQLVNLSALASDCGITHGTARSWLSVLETSFLVFRLPAFRANVTRRLVKTPKLHFSDSGLLCYLLDIRNPGQLRTHPLRGAIFESWVTSEILKARANRGFQSSLSFYRDRKGCEVDVLVSRGNEIIAVETKSGETVARDFFSGLELFSSLIASKSRPADLTKVLVYGGRSKQERSETVVLPWSDVAGYDWVGEDRDSS